MCVCVSVPRLASKTPGLGNIPEPFGGFLHPGKCVAFGFDSADSDSDDDGAVENALEVVKALGAYIGTDEAVKTALTARAEKICSSLEAMDDLPAQTQLILLRQSLQTQLTFVRRTHTPHVAEDALRALSQAVCDRVLKLAGLPPQLLEDVSEVILTLMSLPPRHGGLGVHVGPGQAAIPYSASLMLATNTIKHKQGEVAAAAFAAAPAHSPLLRLACRTLNMDVQADLIAPAADDSAARTKLTGLQRRLQDSLAPSRWLQSAFTPVGEQDVQVATSDPAALRLVEQLSRLSLAWLRAVPTNVTNTVSDEAVQVALRAILGVPLVANAPTHCACCRATLSAGELTKHAYVCKNGPANAARFGRHNLTVAATAKAWRAAVRSGAMSPARISEEERISRIDPNRPQRRHRDDVTVRRTTLQEKVTHIDVTVRTASAVPGTSDWPEVSATAQAECDMRLQEHAAFVAAERGELEPASDLGTLAAVSAARADAVALASTELDALRAGMDGEPTVEQKRIVDGVRGHIRRLHAVASKATESGYTTKMTKYNNLNVHLGVAPLALTMGGLEHRLVHHALPFKEMVKHSNGDKQVVKAAAALKDQWRRRVSLVMVQENGYCISALTSGNSARWRPRGRGLAAGWVDADDW